MKTLLAAMTLVALAACGPLEVRIDETRGVPALTGSTTVTLANYTCGQPVTASGFTVTSTIVTGGCQFSFDQDVQVITAADYQNIPELKGATNLVQRVELTVKKLAFIDGASGAALDLATRITSATLSVNGQQLVDKAGLSTLPKVVVLSGASLTALKVQIDARQPASVRATAVVVVPDSPAPPASLKIDYDAQPAVIIGPGTISF